MYAFLLGIFLFPFIAIAGAFMRGFVIIKLWNYFVFPTWGWLAPSIPVAIGVAMMINYITHQNVDIKSPERSVKENIIRGLGVIFGAPLLIWFLGWIVTFWM
jgi:hypothetical protein